MVLVWFHDRFCCLFQVAVNDFRVVAGGFSIAFSTISFKMTVSIRTVTNTIDTWSMRRKSNITQKRQDTSAIFSGFALVANMVWKGVKIRKS